MPNRTRIQQQIAGMRDPSWFAHRLATSSLPADGQSLLTEALAIDTVVGTDARRVRQQLDLVRKCFGDLHGPQTGAFVDELFGTNGRHVMHAIRESAAWSYGYAFIGDDFWHRPFRTPNDAEGAQLRAAGFLLGLLQEHEGLPLDPVWLAEHARYLSPYGNLYGRLLGAVLDGGDPHAADVEAVLVASLFNKHPVGIRGLHVPFALLTSTSPRHWRMLVDAMTVEKGGEPLRRTILAAAGGGTPEAFRFVLGVIREHGLERHPSVVKAVNAWFNLRWRPDDEDEPTRRAVELAIRLYDDPDAHRDALETGCARDLHIALWTQCVTDAGVALGIAADAVRTDDAEDRRYVAACFLAELGGGAMFPLIRERLETEESLPILAVLATAASSMLGLGDLRAAVDALAARMPVRKTEVRQLVWPWDRRTVSVRNFSWLIGEACKDDPDRLLRHLPLLDRSERDQAVQRLQRAGVQAHTPAGRRKAR